MKKKYLILIIIIIAVVAIIGVSEMNKSNPELETIKVGDAIFTLPDKYVESNLNEMNDTTIENGNDKIYLSTCSNNVYNEAVQYIKDLEKRNLTNNLTTFDVKGTTLYKVDVPGSVTAHYWFELNGKGYTIYSWTKINDLDNIVIGLVESAITNRFPFGFIIG